MGRGLSDYNVLSTGLGILGGMVAGPAGAAAGSTLGGLAEGDDFGEAMMSGMMSFGVGTALQGLSGTAGSFTDPITKSGAIKEVAGETVFKEGTKPFNELVAKKMVGSEGITSNMFGKIDTGTFGNIGKGIEKAGFGDFASRAIKNPKVYTGLGMAGLGLAGQMEPPTLEDPEKRTYAARPNLTEGPARAQNAPGANFAPGYDPEFDYGFAEGGVVTDNDLITRGAAALMDPSFENMTTVSDMIKTRAAPQRRSGGIFPMDRIADTGLLIKRVGPAPQRRGGGILDMGALIQANPNMFNRVTEDEDEDRRFAGGGIVSGNRKYALGDIIDPLIDPRNEGEMISNLGMATGAANVIGNMGVPGVGTAIGALGAGLSASQYQDDLASRGITTEWNDRDKDESANPNFISGAESILNSATMGLVGQSPRERYNAILNRAKGLTGYGKPLITPQGPPTDDAGNELVISGSRPAPVDVTTGDLPPPSDVRSGELDTFGEDDNDDPDDGSNVTIDLEGMPNLPSVDQLSIDQQRERGGTSLPYLSPENVQMSNDLAIQNAAVNEARAAAQADVVPQSFTDAELGPTSWANVSPQALADPSFGEGGMGSSWAQGGLVPGSMNQPQKKYFGIYKKGGPVRSYALGENVDAIEEEQVQQNPIVVEAVAAITGNHPNPEAAIMQFVKIYGQEAFVALREEVIAEASSEERQASGLGALSGPGTGLSDDIPAEVQQGGLTEPAALSVGEQVVPADVVAMLGEGSTEAGSKKIDGMVDEVRMQKTGTKRQAGPLDMDRVSAMVA